MSYIAFKFLHLAAVILFLGNIVTGLFWRAHGDRSADPRIIGHTLEGIIRSDRWFTVPCIVVIVSAASTLLSKAEDRSSGLAGFFGLSFCLPSPGLLSLPGRATPKATSSVGAEWDGLGVLRLGPVSCFIKALGMVGRFCGARTDRRYGAHGVQTRSSRSLGIVPQTSNQSMKLTAGSSAINL